MGDDNMREERSQVTPHGIELSRRDVLKALGVAGLAAVGPNAFSIPCAGEVLPAQSQLLRDASVVVPFALGEVALLDGPFLRACHRSQNYLLDLEPDRLLHNFRVNAGLLPKGHVYGGWESASTWEEIHCQGHTLGHYLSGCALMYGSTRDPRFKGRTDYIVSELRDCQIAGKTGLLCAFPEGNALMDSVLTGARYSGVPWYTLHKVFAGLRDASLYTKSSTALEVLARFSDWALVATASLTDSQFQKMLDEEHGGMNEVLADVSQMTGDVRYLDLAKRFCHRCVLGPLAKSRDQLDGLHANTQIPKVIGFYRLYEQTGQKEYLAASTFFWRTVANTRSFVNGNHGDEEHFFPVADFDRHVFSAKTSETCCDYNMLKLTRMLFQHDPSAGYADFYERALYNDILASQDPDTGMVTYFQGNRPGYRKLYCTPVDSFWCCTGTGMENHAKYNDSIYFRSTDSLYVNLFIPSTVTWGKGTTLAQTTLFPDQPGTRLRWATKHPVKLTLKVRHPHWCRTVTVRIDGKTVLESKQPCSFLELNRVWRNGDAVELDLPMELRAVPLPGSSDIVAFCYGPVVLAGDLGEDLAAGEDLIANERLYGSVANTHSKPPVLTGDPVTLARQARAVESPMTFTLPARGPSTEVTLVPYYKIRHQRYATYWKIEPE
jgi:uncharacterized protein